MLALQHPLRGVLLLEINSQVFLESVDSSATPPLLFMARGVLVTVVLAMMVLSVVLSVGAEDSGEVQPQNQP